MKRYLFMLVLIAMAFASATAQTKPVGPKTKVQLTDDTIQYTLGVYMMQQLLSKSGFEVSDPVMFKKAIDDVLSKRKLMVDPATTEARLIAFQREFTLERNKRLEALLFDKVKKEKGFTALPTGVYYSQVKAGTGPAVGLRDTVVLNVICTLPDNTEVDNFNKTKQSYLSLVNEMIPGLRDVLVRMQEGGIARIIIPASQAYGSTGTLTIPPNSALIYDLAIVNVRKTK